MFAGWSGAGRLAAIAAETETRDAMSNLFCIQPLAYTHLDIFSHCLQLSPAQGRPGIPFHTEAWQPSA